jgi:hypothetical protein
MKNDRGHHKIGKSNKPYKRLKGFKTADPSIEIVLTKEFNTESDAFDFEKYLQNKYKSFKYQLEWFLLPEEELSNLIKFLD